MTIRQVCIALALGLLSIHPVAAAETDPRVSSEVEVQALFPAELLESFQAVFGAKAAVHEAELQLLASTRELLGTLNRKIPRSSEAEKAAIARALTLVIGPGGLSIPETGIPVGGTEAAALEPGTMEGGDIILMITDADARLEMRIQHLEQSMELLRISEQSYHPFRSKVTTDFGAKLPPVSV